jgi:hypothetical protein
MSTIDLSVLDQAVIDAAVAWAYTWYEDREATDGRLTAAADAIVDAIAARAAALAPPPPIERTEVERLRAALIATRDELARWGWGDFHYGAQPQDKRVVDAVALADAALVVSVEPQP